MFLIAHRRDNRGIIFVCEHCSVYDHGEYYEGDDDYRWLLDGHANCIGEIPKEFILLEEDHDV